MQHIAPESLTHLPSRVHYLRDFIQFTREDAAALHAAKPVVAPLASVVVDTVYEKLLSFDITAKAFVPRQTGYSGDAPTKITELNQNHPQIKFRKDFLMQYIVKVVTLDYEADTTWEYFDKVGIMHTGEAGFTHRAKKPGLRVEYAHCAILLGYVEDILVNAVMTHPDLDPETKTRVVRALNKVLWIQNDLFARHYIPDRDVALNQVSVSRGAAVAIGIGLLTVGAGLMKYVLRK